MPSTKLSAMLVDFMLVVTGLFIAAPFFLILIAPFAKGL